MKVKVKKIKKVKMVKEVMASDILPVAMFSPYFIGHGVLVADHYYEGDRPALRCSAHQPAREEASNC